MKHVILGTAGHVDHGKTALIKTLTGIETDRLKEEKERGITIELGFASLQLPSGATVGIVDVPGHEKFVKRMVSGATGIDLVLMVIAADEGIMPQTREHLQICSLLGIKKGLVALTKIDMVDEDWLELVADDVRSFLKDTFLTGSAIIPVSAVTGAGLVDLVAAIDHVVAEVRDKPDIGLFRMPVDRAFSMKGFGTVVTGTVTSGSINTGGAVELMPGGGTTKVRGIQIHNKSSNSAEAGQRAAINLQGTEKDSVSRGQVLCKPASLEPTQRLDVHFQYLSGAGKKIRNRTIVRFHIGTSEIMARLMLLDRDDLEPGEQAFAQINLESPVAAVARDRFVVRRYSPVTTIGGGIVVDPLAQKHKRRSDAVLHELSLLHEGSNIEAALTIIERNGLKGITFPQLVIRTGISGASLEPLIAALTEKGQIVTIDGDDPRIISQSVYVALQNRIVDETKQFHGRFPLKEGISKEELRNTIGNYVNQKLFNAAMRNLEKTGHILTERETVRLPVHRVDLSHELEELRSAILRIYFDAGLATPTIREVTERYADKKSSLNKIFSVLLQEGMLIKITEDIYLHKEVLAKLRESYKSLLLKDGRATPASFKELTGLSRKYIIPLMEYFDRDRLTIRTGDQRILREK